MAEWQVARLIPTWGINSDAEAEMRASSAMLAVLSIVRDFSAALLNPIGAPSARKALVETFIEVAFKLDGGIPARPDGLIRVTYGKKVFTALVEVKTGRNRLQADQVNGYWEVARQFGFDAVITVSNEIPVSGRHPTEGLKFRTKSRVQVHHLSWAQVLATAVMCKVHRGVDDIEQAWILGELIRYLESDASGALSFSDMGPNWVTVRDGARTSTLRKNAPEVKEIAQLWDQLLQFAALRLGREIGADVHQTFPRSQMDPKDRSNHLIDGLCASGKLDGALRVPNAVGPINLGADLRARQVFAFVDVPAPTDRGSRARATWLLKQLSDEVQSQLIIEAWPRNSRTPLTTTLGSVREDRDVLDDPEGRDIARYRLMLRGDAGPARQSGGKTLGFVDSVINLLDRFYGSVVQGITPWVPKAPRLPSKPEPAETTTPAIADSRTEAELATAKAVETAQAEIRETVEEA
ncbi:MAG: stress response protein [Actinomycetota bacterium]